MISRCVVLVFGGWGQISVGILLLALTAAETAYWTLITPPTVKALFVISMEALFFAAYAIIATGIALLATERVASIVDSGSP